MRKEIAKTVLITGAGSGIGYDTAFSLTRRGHNVIASTRTESEATRVLGEAKKAGLEIDVFKLDITLPTDREKIQNLNIDVLINNAAIGESGSLAEVPMDRVRENFEVNVFSTLSLAQIAINRMRKEGHGTVIFISSLAGRIPSAFLGPYSMTKFALSGGVAALRLEMQKYFPDIHIVLVEPGTYATGFNQQMLATKYEWMSANSLFAKIIPQLRESEERRFAHLEKKTTDSIVRQIVKAVESDSPKARYVAPRYQGLYVRLMRIFGK